MKKTIYIAGPMRGLPLCNHPAFFDAEQKLLKEGEYEEVVNPARMDKEANEEFNPRVVLNRDLSAICDKCTAIYMLNGWQKSPGAMSEYNLAKCLELEILYEANEEEETMPVKVDGYDEAIIGLGRRFNQNFYIYEEEKIIKALSKNMTQEEAQEYFEFNILGSYVGEGTPIFMMDVYSDCDAKFCCEMNDEHKTICESCFALAENAIKNNNTTINNNIEYSNLLKFSISHTLAHNDNADTLVKILLMKWDVLDPVIKNIFVSRIVWGLGSKVIKNPQAWMKVLELIVNTNDTDINPHYHITKERIASYYEKLSQPFEEEEEEDFKFSVEDGIDYTSKDEYPFYCCKECGQTALKLQENSHLKQVQVSTWYLHECDICEEMKECTEVRDFQYPNFKLDK